MDTQWPRWLVFKQDSPKKPHQMVGSVHAGDPETALLEARTVFARRPKVVSLWVAPATAVYTLTQEERAQKSHWAQGTTLETWHLFRKTSQRRSMTFVDHVGTIKATSAEHAIQQAQKQHQDGPTTWVWLVVPDTAITRSDAADIESWFAPALDKTYKQQSQYGFVSTVRRSKKDDK